MKTILLVAFGSDEGDVALRAVALSAYNLEDDYNASMETDIGRMTLVIQKTQHPAVQVAAPKVRQIVRETKQMWSFEHEWQPPDGP